MLSDGVFLIGINLQVLPLKNEMKNPNNFNKPLGVLNVDMVMVCFMFVAMGFLSYLKYGDNVAVQLRSILRQERCKY